MIGIWNIFVTAHLQSHRNRPWDDCELNRQGYPMSFIFAKYIRQRKKYFFPVLNKPYSLYKPIYGHTAEEFVASAKDSFVAR